MLKNNKAYTSQSDIAMTSLHSSSQKRKIVRSGSLDFVILCSLPELEVEVELELEESVFSMKTLACLNRSASYRVKVVYR